MIQNFTSPYKAIQAIAAEKLCGHLLVSDPIDSSVSWRIYLGGKWLHYATSSVGQLERIDYLWQEFQSNLGNTSIDRQTLGQTILEAIKFQTLPSKTENLAQVEYQTLYKWAQLSQFPLTDFKALLQKFSQEALIQAISITNARIEFFPHSQPSPILLTLPVPDLLKPTIEEIRQWQSLRPSVLSPLSRIYLDPAKIRHFASFLRQNKDSSATAFGKDPELELLLKAFTQKACLYQACKALDIEPLSLAKWLQPLLRDKTISVLPFQLESGRSPQINPPQNPATIQPQSPQSTETPSPAASGSIIACIDDSQTVQRQVKMALEMSGYQVINITEPASSLTVLVRRKPDLILMDINMPDIDGYELCRMLRQSRQLKQVPIVMLTGRDGLVDRMRAQLVGATAYLTKPVELNQLLETVKKHTNKGSDVE